MTALVLIAFLAAATVIGTAATVINVASDGYRARETRRG